MVHIHWSEMDQRFWLNDGDDVLWFDSALQAQAAQRDIELRDARLEERAAIVEWLRKDRPFWDLNPLADEVERGDYLK